jgi:hypothetical protein
MWTNHWIVYALSGAPSWNHIDPSLLVRDEEGVLFLPRVARPKISSILDGPSSVGLQQTLPKPEVGLLQQEEFWYLQQPLSWPAG